MLLEPKKTGKWGYITNAGSVLLMAVALGYSAWQYVKAFEPDPTPPPAPVVAQGSGSTTVPTNDKNVTTLPALPSSTAATTTVITTKSLPYSGAPFKDADWIKNWGVTNVANGTLNIDAARTTAGGANFLNGTDAWTNYDAEAIVSWTAGESFSIVARAKDNAHFVYCDFGDHVVSIVVRSGSSDTVISSGDSPNSSVGTIQSLGTRVYGNKVACDVNNKDVISVALGSAEPAQGGIGFIVWDPKVDFAGVGVKALNVTQLTTDDIAILPPKPKAPTTPTPAPAAPAPAAPAPAPTPTSTAPAAPAPAPKPVVLTIPYKQTHFALDPNWQWTWGTSSTDPSGALVIEGAPDRTGAMAVLAGSSAWADYKFSATIDWTKGETFAIIARYVNDTNYATCAFYQDPNTGTLQMALKQYNNGVEQDLVSGGIPNFKGPGTKGLQVAIQVQGTHGTCTLNNHVISNVGLGNTLSAPFHGDIGFTNWDPTANNAQIIIRSIDVENIY